MQVVLVLFALYLHYNFAEILVLLSIHQLVLRSKQNNPMKHGSVEIGELWNPTDVVWIQDLPLQLILLNVSGISFLIYKCTYKRTKHRQLLTLLSICQPLTHCPNFSQGRKIHEEQKNYRCIIHYNQKYISKVLIIHICLFNEIMNIGFVSQKFRYFQEFHCLPKCAFWQPLYGLMFLIWYNHLCMLMYKQRSTNSSSS